MSVAMPLAGSHAVVTGGGRGIGLAIAARLAALGASLSLVGRDRSRLYEAVQSLPAGTTCDAYACDVADAAAVDATFAAIARAGHQVSILVNNAGAAKSARLAATDDALWGEMLGVNLSGTFHCMRAALPALLEAKAGRIVNVASTAGVVGSEGELQQVLTNLMLNAIDAMAPQGGGELVARVEVAGDRVRVAIEDSGPGIAEEHLANIFEPFFTTKRHQGGTGLGLSICCNIVEQHGGSIVAENRAAGGGRFTVDLPRAKPDPAAP
jgi:signal transduction histidine kinase